MKDFEGFEFVDLIYQNKLNTNQSSEILSYLEGESFSYVAIYHSIERDETKHYIQLSKSTMKQYISYKNKSINAEEEIASLKNTFDFEKTKLTNEIQGIKEHYKHIEDQNIKLEKINEILMKNHLSSEDIAEVKRLGISRRSFSEKMNEQSADGAQRVRG
jgi:hypothetical protein